MHLKHSPDMLQSACPIRLPQSGLIGASQHACTEEKRNDADTRTNDSRSSPVGRAACGHGAIQRRGGCGAGRGSLSERHAEGRLGPVRGPHGGAAQLWPFGRPGREQGPVYRCRYEQTIDMEVHHPHGSDHPSRRQYRDCAAHVNGRNRTRREDQPGQDRRPDGLA